MFSTDTKCVQSGYNPKNGEPRVLPICQSTTFSYDTPEEMGDLFDLKKEGFFYSRLGNPTVDALEKKITDMDGGIGALGCSSGMAAMTLATLTLCRAGDNIISLSTIYGGTYNLFNTTLPKLGINCNFVEPTASAEKIESLIDEDTKFIFCETIANPAMYVADFEKLSKICKKHKLLLVVDNTLATPVICKPFDLGANIIIYSSSKYLDGHACALGGIIVDGGNFEYGNNSRYEDFNTPDESYHGMIYAKDCKKSAFIVKARVQSMRDVGAIMSPENAFLTHMGIETLHLRMARHSQNATAVAKLLENNTAVEWVKYGGLDNDINNPLVKKYFNNAMASGMVTFGIKGGRNAAAKFQKALKLLRIVTHIADARSCVLHPASTTHRQLTDSDLKACGISDNLIRLSIGIEGTEDIISDIENALCASQK
ncbi:MAG TPA: O-acetylhomoserine aminocarboxypropyltransferase/cysteine synthase family protein [Clostridia bacterium]|nr:O-acetylhomoserine aminocarboxypropyltransferase/cysteine synthase family protein [Clostridia bacterium]